MPKATKRNKKPKLKVLDLTTIKEKDEAKKAKKIHETLTDWQSGFNISKRPLMANGLCTRL